MASQLGDATVCDPHLPPAITVRNEGVGDLVSDA